MTKNEQLQTIVQTHFGRATSELLSMLQTHEMEAKDELKAQSDELSRSVFDREHYTLEGFLMALRIVNNNFDEAYKAWEAE